MRDGRNEGNRGEIKKEGNRGEEYGGHSQTEIREKRGNR